jgi:hypothetical protein
VTEASTTVTCGQCEKVLDEPSHIPIDKRVPCPGCGSTSRHFKVGPAEIWRAQYVVLLNTAKQLHTQGYHEAAIVTAQTASEVCTELVLTDALRAKSSEELADVIGQMIRNYSLDTARVRGLYVAVTGDRIQSETFWQSFKEHANRRHKIVHRGRQASAQEADDSTRAVESVIQHLLENRSG